MSMAKGKSKPLKLGVRLDPPAIVYIYSESNKMRMRVMPLRNIWPKSDTNFVLDEFLIRHGMYLEAVPKETIKKMINIVKEHKKGLNLPEILKKYENKIDTKTKTMGQNEENEIYEPSTQQRKTNNPFSFSDKKSSLQRKSSEITNISTDFQEEKRNSKFFTKRNSNYINNTSDSDSKNHQYDSSSESDDDFEIDKINKENEKFTEGKKVIDLTKEKEKLPKTSLFKLKDSKKLIEPTKEKDLLGNTKNTFKGHWLEKNESQTKLNTLKELLDVHNKIESVGNVKINKNEDDTDVEYDDTDIPLEEDFY